MYTRIGDRHLVVEIDEHAHRYVKDDRQRECELYIACKFQQTVIIRFNTDAYTDEEGRHPSPWTRDSTGKDAIKDSHLTQWKARLNILRDTIRQWINPETICIGLVVLPLFYGVPIVRAVAASDDSKSDTTESSERTVTDESDRSSSVDLSEIPPLEPITGKKRSLGQAKDTDTL